MPASLKKSQKYEARHAGALVLVRRHRLLRGNIDGKVIILIVLVLIFVLFGVAAWFFNGSQPNPNSVAVLPRGRACGLGAHLSTTERDMGRIIGAPISEWAVMRRALAIVRECAH